jgi:hypothetical protein
MPITRKEAKELQGKTVRLTRDYDMRTFVGTLTLVDADTVKVTGLTPGRPSLQHRANVLHVEEVAPVRVPTAPATAAPVPPAEDRTAEAVSRALDIAVEDPAVMAALVATLREAVHSAPVQKAFERRLSDALTNA